MFPVTGRSRRAVGSAPLDRRRQHAAIAIADSRVELERQCGPRDALTCGTRGGSMKITVTGRARCSRPPSSRAARTHAATSERARGCTCSTAATSSPWTRTCSGSRKRRSPGDGSFVTPCYLVVHAKGTLDLGRRPDSRRADSRRRHRGGGAGPAQGASANSCRSCRRWAITVDGHHLHRDVALPPRSHRERQPVRGLDLDRAAGRVRRDVRRQGIRDPRCLALRQAQGRRNASR